MTSTALKLSAVLAAVVVAAGCQQGGADKPSASPTSSATVTPMPGSVAVQHLTFVPPPGLRQVTDKGHQRNPNASYEMSGKAGKAVAPPVLDVFVERGDVGPLKARAASIVDMVKVQLRDAKILRNQQLRVPGAQSAQVIEFTFTCQGPDRSKKIPCHQVEVLVQMRHKPQYGMRYGMPATLYKKANVDSLLGSIRVTR